MRQVYQQRRKKQAGKKPQSCLVDSEGAFKCVDLIAVPSSGSCEEKITGK